ncbi:MAG: ankyrin repeat domain-containing protein [Candidatus Peribacteria bacterium]|nr:ankyrin repeat domain-containing protein [Candidatus Peribacteria bacterium]
MNIQDKNGMTALMWASLNGSIELVKLLIDA